MVICLLIGIIFPFFATYLDITNLPPGIKCGTPSIGFVVLGLAATGVVIPIMALIFYAITYYQRTRTLKFDQNHTT